MCSNLSPFLKKKVSNFENYPLDLWNLSLDIILQELSMQGKQIMN